tara:strand:- start:2566 stop:2856 length:291 start_codon:yes stop_codon:yes gene_type:complete
MDPTSTLQVKAVVNATHDGEALDIDKGQVISMLRRSVSDLIHDQEEGVADVRVQVYVSKFTYSDNVDSLRDKLRGIIDTMDSEELAELIDQTTKRN